MIIVGADGRVRNSFLHATDEKGSKLAHGRVANSAEALAQFCSTARAAASADHELTIHARPAGATQERRESRAYPESA